jgi:hypothetical protein
MEGETLAGHNVEARWASQEIADMMTSDVAQLIESHPGPITECVTGADMFPRSWPYADGAIAATVSGARSSTQLAIAVEYKRPEEGIHGLLTAIGQSAAYLNKGYDAAIMIVPDNYPGLSNPGDYLAGLLARELPNSPIAVCTYAAPDPSALRPFDDRLFVSKKFEGLRARDVLLPAAARPGRSRTPQPYAHTTEGVVVRDYVYRYLESVTLTESNPWIEPTPIPTQLVDAVHRIDSGASPREYLSNTPAEDDSIEVRAWQEFWIRCIVSPVFSDPPWSANLEGQIEQRTVSTLLMQDGGTPSRMFASGRVDSPVAKALQRLDRGEITMDGVWESLANSIRQRAHQTREDITSFVDFTQLVMGTGQLSPLARVFLDACRLHGSDSRESLDVFAAILIGPGEWDILLHHIEAASRELFSKNNWTRYMDGNQPDTEAYLVDLHAMLRDVYRIMNPAASRGNQPRKALQRVMPYLTRYDLVERDGNRFGFQPGRGLVINWGRVQQLSERFLDRS